MYSRLNYVVFLPSILIAFIAPKIMSKISIPKIFVCNVILQIICSIVIGSLPFYKDHISVTYLLFVFHALSFAGTCIAQIAIFSFNIPSIQIRSKIFGKGSSVLLHRIFCWRIGTR
ncbi:hypothetical protein MHBO_001716 [Bonamia ostreae]|uniref:Uncharacterized protein n=1 Tax=Bonamia ostreae TaxID=126728 RepID=A0ABV2AJX7_9EUKA